MLPIWSWVSTLPFELGTSTACDTPRDSSSLKISPFLFMSPDSITLLSPRGPEYSDFSAFVFRAMRTHMSLFLASGESDRNWETRPLNSSRGVTFGCQASPRFTALFIAMMLVPPIHILSSLLGLGSKEASSKLTERSFPRNVVSPFQSALTSFMDSLALLPLV